MTGIIKIDTIGLMLFWWPTDWLGLGYPHWMLAWRNSDEMTIIRAPIDLGKPSNS